MEENNNFYTLKGYQLIQNKKLTPAMEDYIEMICRLKQSKEFIRINELSQMLHVKPSSATKMVNNLKASGLVLFEKYSYIIPTTQGKAIGEYFLKRHDILNSFLCYINNSEDELEEVEKIEHFLSRRTISNIETFLQGIKNKGSQ